jgi:hypothetical protein
VSKSHDQDQVTTGSSAWLLTKIAENPRLAGDAAGHVIGNASNDACLKARRYLEHYWAADPSCPPAGRDYREAAQALETAGQARLAELCYAIAATDDELLAASQAWTSRYTWRPATESDTVLAQLLSDGLIDLDPAGPRLGTDGAWYQPGTVTGMPAGSGAADPVVLVSTMTGRELVTGFASEQAAQAWLRQRSRTGEPRRRLTDPAVEHLPRVTLEEHVLAWMLHHPRAMPGDAQELRERMWTADVRHEIDAALRTATSHDLNAGYREISRELGRRMLRAPAWADDQVGAPFGHWAQAYLLRLMATTVTEAAARRAFQALAVSADHSTRPSAPAAARPSPRPAAVEAAGRQPGHEAMLRRQAGFLDRLGPGLARPGSLGARFHSPDLPPGPRP